MYPNLRAEMARRNVTSGMLAGVLNVTESTASLKLNGKAPLTLDEAFTIEKYLDSVKPFESAMSLQVLFARAE